MVKGLREYVEKHGMHFTVELAYDATNKFYDVDEIEKELNKKVYYNVSGYTMGDAVYIFNGWTNERDRTDKKYRADNVRWILEDSGYLDIPTVFELWVKAYARDFDFTPYI